MRGPASAPDVEARQVGRSDAGAGTHASADGAGADLAVAAQLRSDIERPRDSLHIVFCDQAVHLVVVEEPIVVLEPGGDEPPPREVERLEELGGEQARAPDPDVVPPLGPEGIHAGARVTGEDAVVAVTLQVLDEDEAETEGVRSPGP